jgi:RHS repeat-associated protein
VPWFKHEFAWYDGQPLVQMHYSDGPHWYFTDHLGTPILQTNAAGTVVWRVEYEPYGDIWQRRVPAPVEEGPTPTVDQPLRFPGQEAVMTWEGNEERYNIYRWYRAGWGRYTQADPIGVVQLGQPRMDLPHNNLFGYVSGRPTTLVDPLGLKPCNSGKCADCESGVWTLTKMTQKVFFMWGFAWETNTTYTCYGSSLSCTTVSKCEALGAGWGAGVSVSGGITGRR